MKKKSFYLQFRGLHGKKKIPVGLALDISFNNSDANVHWLPWEHAIITELYLDGNNDFSRAFVDHRKIWKPAYISSKLTIFQAMLRKRFLFQQKGKKHLENDGWVAPCLNKHQNFEPCRIYFQHLRLSTMAEYFFLYRQATSQQLVMATEENVAATVLAAIDNSWKSIDNSWKSMDHPKDQPLCLVNWTSPGKQLTTPLTTMEKTSHPHQKKQTSSAPEQTKRRFEVKT